MINDSLTPLPSVRDELVRIRSMCMRLLRLLMSGSDGVMIEDLRRTLVLIDKSVGTALRVLDEGDDR